MKFFSLILEIALIVIIVRLIVSSVFPFVMRVLKGAPKEMPRRYSKKEEDIVDGDYKEIK